MTAFILQVDHKLHDAFQSLYGDYFEEYPCSQIKVKAKTNKLTLQHLLVKVNFKVGDKSFIVDEPLKELTKEAVQKEPMLRYRAASENSLYEIVLVNFEHSE